MRVFVALAVLTAALAAPAARAQAQPVTNAPSIEPAVRAILASLPPDDVARVRQIEFGVPPTYPGACAETWVTLGRIVISTDPRCIVLLLGVLIHEIGHLTPTCAALAIGQQWQASEECADLYRRQHEARWRLGA